MRNVVSVLIVVCVLTGCDAGSLTAPQATPIQPAAGAIVAAQAPTRKFIACRGGATATQPLYVVDGRIVTSDAALLLDADTFESIEIIEGATASAVYGSRAARGVVLITTRNKRPPAAG